MFLRSLKTRPRCVSIRNLPKRLERRAVYEELNLAEQSTPVGLLYCQGFNNAHEINEGLIEGEVIQTTSLTMAEPTHQPARRRSSIAYDPARDIFKATADLPSIEESEPTTTLQENVGLFSLVNAIFTIIFLAVYELTLRIFSEGRQSSNNDCTVFYSPDIITSQ